MAERITGTKQSIDNVITNCVRKEMQHLCKSCKLHVARPLWSRRVVYVEDRKIWFVVNYNAAKSLIVVRFSQPPRKAVINFVNWDENSEREIYKLLWRWATWINL